MKKRLSKGKIALIVVGALAFLWGATLSTDVILAHYSKPPVFAIRYPDDGGNTDTYIGLFYVVQVHHYVTACPLDEPPCTYEHFLSVEIYSWFYRE